MAAKKKSRGTRQSTMNKRRKGALSVVIPWMKRFGAVLGVAVAVIWIGSWLVLSGTVERAGNWVENSFLMASADMGLAVENVLVEGRAESDANVIMAIINIQKGDPLLSFDPHEAQHLIEQVSWIKTAQVERRWPDTIYIGLQEKTPVALWKNGDQVKLLDQSGEVIVAEKGKISKFKNLIAVSGDGSRDTVGDLLSDLSAHKNIRERVSVALRIGERRWDLGTDNGVKIKMPEDGQQNALERLARAQEEDALLDQDITEIDMREQDRISIRTAPGKIQDYKANMNKPANDSSKKSENI
ncbi:MAG: FtsQ-type POTRA domain-containing protein [Alphaproteobacteria bacterium]|nr:FtsQ-type POTRA domain-containing protein [Alphaproteobacteria bacterium]